MKKKIIYAVIALFSFSGAYAQAPAGFAKGTVTLADGSAHTGYIKDKMKKDASIVYLDEAGKKQQLSGDRLNNLTIEGNTYLCIKNDFFKVICAGEISFLQKASNASGKVSYNGTEAILISGTAGKAGDYFYYTNNELTPLNRKSTDAIISQLGSCAAAAEKAKSAGSDMALLADALAIYNSSKK